MRKFFYVLGAMTLIVVIVVAVGLAVVAYKGKTLDAESKAFVDKAIPTIVASASKELLFQLATPELRESTKPEDLNTLFDIFSRLGPLVAYEGATGDATMSYMAGTGGTVSATYVANAKFQNGTATFRIVVLKRDDRWMIHNFNINPKLGSQQRTLFLGQPVLGPGGVRPS